MTLWHPTEFSAFLADKQNKSILTYHETKSRFAWIGEIENEQLLTALETLKVEDLEIITMYAYEGYDITEISKVYGVSRPTISIKIKRITKFLKNFNFNATN